MNNRRGVKEGILQSINHAFCIYFREWECTALISISYIYIATIHTYNNTSTCTLIHNVFTILNYFLLSQLYQLITYKLFVLSYTFYASGTFTQQSNESSLNESSLIVLCEIIFINLVTKSSTTPCFKHILCFLG